MANATLETAAANVTKALNSTDVSASFGEKILNNFDDIIMDTPADAINDYKPGWGSYLKISLIILKVGAIVAMMLMGIYAHQRRSGCTISTFILLGYIIVLVGMCVSDLTTKFIAVFYGMILFANYLNFLGLLVILRNVPTHEGEKLKKQTTPYMWTMNLLYLTCLALSIFWVRPVCQHQKVYPYCMNWAACLFLVNAVYNWALHASNYGMKWEGSDAIYHKQTSKFDIFGTKYHDKEGAEFEMTTEKLQTTFTRMMKWYTWFQLFVFVYNICMQILGRLTLNQNGSLACLGGGNQWEYQSIWGETFVALHIFCLITQAVMIERVYYSIPHSEGLFTRGKKNEIKEDSYV